MRWCNGGVELVGVGVLRRVGWFASFPVLVAELGCLCEVVSPAGLDGPGGMRGTRTELIARIGAWGFQAAVRLGTSWSAWGGSGSAGSARISAIDSTDR